MENKLLTEVLLSGVLFIKSFNWGDIMYEVIQIKGFARYFILKKEDEYFLLDNEDHFLPFLFFPLSWYIPHHLYSVTQREVEELKRQKHPEGRSSILMILLAVSMSQTLQPIYNFFEIPLDRNITAITFLAIATMIIFIRKRMSEQRRETIGKIVPFEERFIDLKKFHPLEKGKILWQGLPFYVFCLTFSLLTSAIVLIANVPFFIFGFSLFFLLFLTTNAYSFFTKDEGVLFREGES